ncbi:Mus7/MMS22 family-domain-containing protein [Bombardia bombarda]|uniref:Mus7/MMS22 family-domain-containing protein n=1 Tax=Bombardia bombarda TaxID=252184 RepID=A0AA39XIS2_9PEZI|nr:Mus7/MMS22 family-domain-containing protein [Bombardia bombarda]
MKNWRELGEVPDSDDESLDIDINDPDNDTDNADDKPGSQEHGHRIFQLRENALEDELAQDVPPQPPKDADIWSVPSSPLSPISSSRYMSDEETRPEQDDTYLPSRPLSERNTLEILLYTAPRVAVDEAAATPVEPPAVTELAFLEDEISTGYVRITSPLSRAVPSSLSSKASKASKTPRSPEPSRIEPSQPQNRGTSTDDEENLSRQAAVRLERSLRPRKPIQQHPYLLENAQYSTFMKSHGIKPVKVVVPPQSARKTTEKEDSQEQEFQAEESQEARGRDDTTQPTEESEPILFDDDVDDRDELALSPSPSKTSPLDHQLQASSQQTNGNHTDITNFSGDDEFPSLEELVPETTNSRSRRLKRQRSLMLSAASKRQKNLPAPPKETSPHRRLIPPPGIWELSSSPSKSQTPHDSSQDLSITPRPLSRRPAVSPLASSRRQLSSTNPPRRIDVDFSILETSDQQIDLSGPDSDSDSASSTHSSKSGSDVVRQNVRRIKGVLPASWLRLDQQKDKAVAAVRTARNSPEPPLHPGVRRGIALPKQSTPRQSIADPFVFDDSDESDGGGRPTPVPNRAGEISRSRPAQTRPPPPVGVLDDDDDGASDMEDDFIDRMLPGRGKRKGSFDLSGRAKRRKKRISSSTFDGRPGQNLRQPKITQALGRSKSAAAAVGTPSRGATAGQRRQRTTSSRNNRRAATPPRLSILDVMEPQAPRFIKIAARVVKKKADLGKVSPSRKVVSLATRQDNIDALSALRDWKSGKTRPRVSVRAATAAPRRPPEGSGTRTALQEINSNTPQTPRPRLPSSLPQKPARQASLAGLVTVSKDVSQQQPPQKPPQRTVSMSILKTPRRKTAKVDTQLRPAQLETAEGDSPQRGALSSKKRSLDAFYRRSRKALGPAERIRLDKSIHVHLLTLQQEPEHAGTIESNNAAETPPPPQVNRREARKNAKSRFRKRNVPRSIDTEALQYTRANDPLPAEVTPVDLDADEEAAAAVVVVVENHANRNNNNHDNKLQGLGPYGTVYTQHFDVFPLERGTFFHESTVIGRGHVRRAAEPRFAERIRRQQHHPRPAVSFVLDDGGGQALRWGVWDDRTSSEFGILVDWVAEQLLGGSEGGKVVEAAAFVLGYVLDGLSVGGEDEERAFVARFLEVMGTFVGRLEAVDWAVLAVRKKKAWLEVAVRFAVAILPVYSLSREGIDVVQGMKVEELLKRMATVVVKGLVGFGMEELRALYGDLQRFSVRERGIPPRQVLANCWVVMMRVLESANIPRSSFWDVTHSVMLSSTKVASGCDAQVFERLWQDTFTLLPLGEVDNSGILIPGLRNAVPLEGWSLPQQLLKRVFGLYKSNTRQPPSFNEYCRALVARCHFLIQLWGWRKCTGIVGTIFDFFGSQSLAHLRNEEVYRSPKFLEELGRNPSLAIEPDDRCFHIFIKILALAIQRLKQLGRLNDIRNLVARTLPNHNRQYLKEDIIHQHDLAALRNHHDLLCTLFWAAPPDLRPAVHLIEKLVTPGTAHKEACLINIRAWNQLARFVVASGEGAAAFRPFVSWRNNVFNQVLDQYLSAASDIEQQFRALSKDMPGGISVDVRDDMIAKNKATAMDVLHFSVKASLDVQKYAPDLGTTMYALSTPQLQKVFSSLDFRSPGFDWGVLRVAIETLEHYLGRVDEVSEEQYSSEFVDQVDTSQIEDAVLLINEQLAKEYFYMSRATIGMPMKKTPFGRQTDQAVCAEKTVILAARIVARFVKDRLTQLAPYFTPGKYGLFSDLPRNLTGPERKYLPLFIANLVKNHVFDFKDLGTNILGLWMLAIIKPLRFMGYENHLAEVLQRKGLPFLDKATAASVAIAPDYNSSVELFSCALHHMRRALREAGSSAQSKQSRDESAKVLQLAMQKMKEDLALLRAEAEGDNNNNVEHLAYIAFVRQLISLIKSHGVGICVIDVFFTQPSLDYVPSSQDPQLHMAGIIAYGVRLSEKEFTAVPQLFYYLYNNFKIALGNDRLAQECGILEKAMGNDRHVLGFVLQYMLPATIRACEQADEAWILLETYVKALGNLLTGACVPRELAGEDVEEHVVGVLASILAWLGHVRDGGDGSLSAGRLRVVGILAGVANILQPSLRTYLFSGPSGESEKQFGLVEAAVDDVGKVFAEACDHLGETLLLLLAPGEEDGEEEGRKVVNVHAAMLLSGLPPSLAGVTASPRVQEFAKTIVVDVRKSWIVEGELVTVQMAGRGPAAAGSGPGAGGAGIAAAWLPTPTQSVGTRCPPLGSIEEMMREVYGLMGEWKLGREFIERKRRSKRRGGLERVGGAYRRGRGVGGVMTEDDLFF